MAAKFDKFLGKIREWSSKASDISDSGAAGRDILRMGTLAEIRSSVSKDWADAIPVGGIPSSNLSAPVQASLGKADTALQTVTVQQINLLLNSINGLIVNGSGQLLNNYGFTGLTFDDSDATIGSEGMFVGNSASPWPVIYSDNLLSVDVNSRYQVVLYAKQVVKGTPSPLFYAGFAQYDTDGLEILPEHFGREAASDTTLAAPLAPGDTTITLSSSAGWYVGGGINDQVLLFGYRDSKGKIYDRAIEPYTRYTTANGSSGNFASITGNTVNLSTPFALANTAAGSGGVWPAGTKISQAKMGGTWNYGVAEGVNVATATWDKFECFLGGIDMAGAYDQKKFRPGVRKIRMVFRPNCQGGSSDYLGISGVGMYRVPLSSLPVS